MNRATTGIAAVALLLCLPCIAQADESSSSGAGQDEQFALDQSAIVVLPVDVLSDESKYSDLADTVYRALVRQIAKIDGIHVIDPTIVIPFIGSEDSPSEIGRQLGAATVVRSTVSAGAPRGYRISVRCVDARVNKNHFTSSMLSYKNWEPESEEGAINGRVSSIVESIEQSLFPDRWPDPESKSDTARTTFLDSSLGEVIRLTALNDLRPPSKAGYPPQYMDGGAALSGDIAIVAAQFASESKDPHVRGRIWRVMTGVPDPVLIQPLIHSLGYDKVAWVRERAAIALAAHNKDLGVREALDSARINDPDPKVRRAAHLAVSTQEGRRELFRKFAMDVDAPEPERIAALFKLRQINRVDPVPMDEELIGAMVTFAQTAREARTRHQIWFSLGQVAGPDVVDDLVDALAEEPSESVREWVVHALRKNIDEPGVRDALENAQLNDPSPLVRNTAERVLLGKE